MSHKVILSTLFSYIVHCNLYFNFLLDLSDIGRGIQGTTFPGCSETFESSLEGAGLLDRHQKVFRYKEGDILALPAGAVHWTYNDGETPIVLIVLHDTSNVANQLDRNFKVILFLLINISHGRTSSVAHIMACATVSFHPV